MVSTPAPYPHLGGRLPIDAGQVMTYQQRSTSDYESNSASLLERLTERIRADAAKRRLTADASKRPQSAAAKLADSDPAADDFDAELSARAVEWILADLSPGCDDEPCSSWAEQGRLGSVLPEGEAHAAASHEQEAVSIRLQVPSAGNDNGRQAPTVAWSTAPVAGPFDAAVLLQKVDQAVARGLKLHEQEQRQALDRKIASHDVRAEVAELSARLARLECTLEQKADLDLVTSASAATGLLSARIEVLATKQQSAPDGAQVAALGSKLEAIERAVEAIVQRAAPAKVKTSTGPRETTESLESASDRIDIQPTAQEGGTWWSRAWPTGLWRRRSGVMDGGAADELPGDVSGAGSFSSLVEDVACEEKQKNDWDRESLVATLESQLKQASR